jgi:hypothetical protein
MTHQNSRANPEKMKSKDLAGKCDDCPRCGDGCTFHEECYDDALLNSMKRSRRW